MATSGTYAFSPEIQELCDEAFERAGVDPETLTARHLRSARRSLNLIFSDWSNDGIKLWAIEQETLDLVASTATYNCPDDTIAILEVVLRRAGTDTLIDPMARDEYIAIPDKTTEGRPSQYYLDRGRTTPTITLWQVPENSTDDLIYYRMRQLQDVGNGSNTPDIPYRWNEALTAALAVALARKYRPDRLQLLEGPASDAYRRARTEDRQRTPTKMWVNYRG
jgi:hypothetical protein